MSLQLSKQSNSTDLVSNFLLNPDALMCKADSSAGSTLSVSRFRTKVTSQYYQLLQIELRSEVRQLQFCSRKIHAGDGRSDINTALMSTFRGKFFFWTSGAEPHPSENIPRVLTIHSAV